MPIKSPYEIRQKSPLLRLLSPTSVGTLTAATFALYPKVADGTLIRVSHLDRWDLLANVPGRAYGVIVGFLLGYGGVCSLEWLRWKLLKALLAYTGWVYNPKSLRAKSWAILLKIVKGPGPHSTFAFQDILPKLPLPALDATLDKWLDVNRQLLTADEFEMTQQAVEEFRKNEGPKIQEYLEEKAKNTVNWVSDYWTQAAYLACRDSLAINSNYPQTCGAPITPTDPLIKMAVWVRLSAQFHALIDKQLLEPILTQELVPLCMNGFNFLFNSTREPREHMDTLTKYPKSRHIFVIRNSHYFKLDLYVEDGHGQTSLLTTEELRAQFKRICDVADDLEIEPGVGALTAQRRNVWAKDREQLKVKNAETLHVVESAMFGAIMDPVSPKDYSEHCKMIMTGSGEDRWFDKCFTTVVFGNAMSGNTVEHTVLDAMVLNNFGEHYFIYETELLKNFDINKPITTKLDVPQRLLWDVTGMETTVSNALDSFKQVIDDIDVYALTTKFGKGVMKKFRMSPDGYVQMALQLAYYRLHKEIPKTYEPSTGRLYALGRTETVHPVSSHSVSWVKSMDDPEVEKDVKVQELRKAVKYQAKFRLDATMGGGCDRHLLAFYCASRELGMDIPRLFMDKAWQMPFKLSTSNVPVRMKELGCEIDFDACCGGFGPTAHDGYGVCYMFHGENSINMRLTSWKSAEETDSVRLGDTIEKAMDDLRTLLS